MLWVSDNEIPENQVIEANIKKVSKIKSYNLASSISGKPGIYMRDNSCVCNVCLRGDVLTCKERKSGEYKLFSLEKKKGRNQVELVSSDSESSDEEDFQYDSAVDDSRTVMTNLTLRSQKLRLFKLMMSVSINLCCTNGWMRNIM